VFACYTGKSLQRLFLLQLLQHALD